MPTYAYLLHVPLHMPMVVVVVVVGGGGKGAAIIANTVKFPRSFYLYILYTSFADVECDGILLFSTTDVLAYQNRALFVRWLALRHVHIRAFNTFHHGIF